MEVRFGNKKINIDVKKSSGIRGLMFRKKETDALIFTCRGGIHSLFVFFPFLCLWLDEENKIVDWKIVKPWSRFVCSDKDFVRVLEVPINDRYKKLLAHFIRSN